MFIVCLIKKNIGKSKTQDSQRNNEQRTNQLLFIVASGRGNNLAVLRFCPDIMRAQWEIALF
jgi:hypothetical protein